MGQVLPRDYDLSEPVEYGAADHDDVELPNWGSHHPIAWGAAAIGFLLAGFLMAAIVLAVFG